MGTSSRKSLAPGKAPKDNVHPNVRCCLTPRERGCQVGFLSVHPVQRRTVTTLCHTHMAPAAPGMVVISIPTLQGKDSKACTCSTVLLPLWENPSGRTWHLCCISAAGTATKIVPEKAGTLFSPFF